MSTFQIHHQHSDDKKTACEKAEHMLDDIASKYGLDIESDGDGQINFKGSGIDGCVEIHHNEILFSANLGFFMSAMQTVISSEIKKKLDKTFI